MKTVQFLEHTTMAKLGTFLRLDLFKLVHPKFEPGKVSDEIEVVNVHRGDAVAGLLHIVGPSKQAILLVEQFRMSTLLSPETGLPNLDDVINKKENAGHILELMAGMQKPGEPWLEAFRRECYEETNLEPDEITFIGSFYPSPGACSEQIHLYYGRIDWPEDRDWPETDTEIQSGHGVETEDIRRHFVTPKEFLEMIADGRIQDGKCLAAAEWMRRPEHADAIFDLNG